MTQTLARWDEPVAVPSTESYWCDTCGLPLLESACGLCGRSARRFAPANVRPVFREELIALERLTGIRPIPEPADMVLWRSGRRYYRDGRQIAQVSLSGDCMLTLDACRVTRTRERNETARQFSERLGAANDLALSALEWDAFRFIHALRSDFADVPVVVAFSGGKDSTVVSHLVRTALGRSDIPHVFADTTLEFPETLAFVATFARHVAPTPVLTALPQRGFRDVCREIGPPSRLLRWCCTTHKIAPLGELYHGLDGNGRIVTFGGVRRRESRARAVHARVLLTTKIEGEAFASPIIHWTDAAVWLYTLARRLPMNEAYRKGFDRVGCMICPMNSAWSEHLCQAWHPEAVSNWEDFLADCASPHRDDSLVFARTGSWKARAGFFRGTRTGWDLPRTPCNDDVQACSYEVEPKDTGSFWEFLKPLGRVLRLHNDGIVDERMLCSRDSEWSLHLRMVWPRRHLGVRYNGPPGIRRRVLQWLERQLRKSQSCIECGACATLCPTGAIEVSPGNGYRVSSRQCTACLRCVTRLPRGCPAVHSLSHY